MSARKCASIGGKGSPHHRTPGWVLDAVRGYAGGQIALDPCGRAGSLVNAAVEYWGPKARDEKHRIDGLEVHWHVDAYHVSADRVVAYMNPPYTRHVIDRWVVKALGEGQLRIEVIGLLPARTSAAWFQYCFPPKADALCFLSHRVKFLGSSSAPAWESVLVYWGEHPVWFADSMKSQGVAAAVWYR